MPDVEYMLKEIEGYALTLCAAHTAAMVNPPSRTMTDLYTECNDGFIACVKERSNEIALNGTKAQRDRLRELLEPLEWCKRQR